VKWTPCYLYVILDIYSRYVVGWIVAHRELSALARKLIAETCAKQMIQPDQLLIHADRGSSMTSKSVTLLPADLGVIKSHSRPSVSNDNPYSKSQFKTMKYRPEFPERFGSIEDARAFCQTFFPWHNTEHYHLGLGLLTPEDVHYGRAARIIEDRKDVARVALKNIRSGSRGGYRHRRHCLTPPGSTSRRLRAMEGYTKYLREVSHFH
jgi:putative transposase